MMKLMNDRGSVTIEAALVLPIILVVFVTFLALMQGAYTHAKVQKALNDACLDMSYDVYALDSIGLLDGITSMSRQSLSSTLTIDEVFVLKDLLEKVGGGDTAKLGISYENPDAFYTSVGEVLGKVDDLSTFVGKLSNTFKAEGIYFMNRSFAATYIESAMEKSLGDEFPKVKVIHGNVFTEDDSGLIIVEYNNGLLMNLGPITSFRMRNSGFVYSYSGDREISDQYHSPSKVSEYGTMNGQGSDEKDQDGFFRKVYVCDNGRKYHSNRRCFHIDVKYIPITYRVIRGSRRLCSNCYHGEELNELTIVYYTLSGDVIHMDVGCHSIYHNVTRLSEKDAIVRGYLPCLTCEAFQKIGGEDTK